MPLSLLLPKFPEIYLSQNFTLLIAMLRHRPQNLPEFDPYSPSIYIADLRDFIYWMNPHVIIPNNFKLDDYQKTAYKLLHPTEDRPSRNYTPKPQNLREALLAAFDPNAPGMRIADLKEFITQLSPGTPIPTKIRLGELREIACNLIRQRSKSAETSPRSIKEFNPYASHICKADLQEFIYKNNPDSHIPGNIMLAELREMANAIIHPQTVHSQVSQPRCKIPQSRATSPDCLELRSRSASPPLINIKNFNPYAPQIRKADLKNIILQIDSSYHVPSNVTLVELKNMTYRLIHPHCNLPQTSQDQNKRPWSRAGSPAQPGLRSRSALPHLKSIWNFDPYASHICKANLQEVILQIDPSCHIPSNTRLSKLRDMVYRMIHPQSVPALASKATKKRPQSRATSPARPGLRMRSALPALKNINTFDPYASHICKANLQEFILQIDPSSHIPSNTRRAELRDMAYRMIHPQSAPWHASNVQASQSTQPGHRTRLASPAIISIKNFDPYAPHIKKADLRKVIFQIDPCSHVPSNIGLSALRDLVYQMIHPCTVNPQASNADKAPKSRAASPAQSELRLRSDQLLSRSIKNFDPYAPHINKADLREVIFQIDSNSQIPNNIRLAELRNMAFRMIHPHDSLPQEDFEFDHFDPYDSNVQLSHLREFIFKMDPNCHIPSDVRLPHLCDLTYRLLSPSNQACPSAPAPSVNYSLVWYPSTSRKSQSPHRVQFLDQHMTITGKQIHSNVSSQKTFTHDAEIGNEYGQCSSGKSTANEDHNEISDESQESNSSAGSKDNNNEFEVSSDDSSDSSKSIAQRGCLKKQRLLKSQSSEAGTPGTSKPPTLTHNCVSSPLPFAPPCPPKPPALCPSQLDRVHQLPAVQSNFCFQSNETIPESGVKIVDHDGFIKALLKNPLQDQLTAKGHHLAIVKNFPSNLSEMPPVQDFLTTEKSNSLSSKCSAGNNTTIPTKLPTTMQHIDLPGAEKTISLITNPMNVSLMEKQISGSQSRRSLEHPGPIKSMPKLPNVGLFATTNTNLEACKLERQFSPHNEAVLQSHLHHESVPINFGEPTSFGIASIQGSLAIAPAPIPISKNTTTSLAIAPAPIPISKSATTNRIMSSNSIIHDKNLQQSLSTNQSSNLYQTTSSLQSGSLDAFPAVLNPSVELEQPNTTLGIVTQSERLFKSNNIQLSASTILTHNPWATKKEFKPVPLTPLSEPCRKKSKFSTKDPTFHVNTTAIPSTIKLDTSKKSYKQNDYILASNQNPWVDLEISQLSTCPLLGSQTEDSNSTHCDESSAPVNELFQQLADKNKVKILQKDSNIGTIAFSTKSPFSTTHGGQLSSEHPATSEPSSKPQGHPVTFNAQNPEDPSVPVDIRFHHSTDKSQIGITAPQKSKSFPNAHDSQHSPEHAIASEPSSKGLETATKGESLYKLQDNKHISEEPIRASHPLVNTVESKQIFVIQAQEACKE
ncbi:hypothetical protein BY996DRAFT_6425162 [Phakopsora pachyrhizi]|nr:hypothetical protein BY996DRAFT_6425162 [Phakopsora pachyrhizi]